MAEPSATSRPKFSVRTWRAGFDVRPECEVSRRLARIYMRWFDHEILRHVWANQWEIAPGVFRSNHPTFARLKRLRDAGVKSVLSLRGTGGAQHGSMTVHCATLGMVLHVLPLSARRAPDRESLLALIDLFRRMDHPFVMHCKSGADRTGLASAVYLMAIEGQGVDVARRMLALQFLHARWGKAGILDRFLAVFARDGRGRSFEDWLRHDYDPADLSRGASRRSAPVKSASPTSSRPGVRIG
jgi:protein tyrosine phosphatase (PTP) superfamily phosphohydrolase (DUF442 family)